MNYMRDEIRDICVKENIKIGALEAAIIFDFISRYRSGERDVVIAAGRAGKKNKKTTALEYIRKNPGCTHHEVPVTGSYAVVRDLHIERKIHVSGFRHTPKRTIKEFSFGDKEDCRVPSYNLDEIRMKNIKKTS